MLPKRWVAKRTLAWLDWNHRLSKNYERNPTSSECFLFFAAIMVLLCAYRSFFSHKFYGQDIM